jgi:toxin ParE1/3/4
VARRVYFSRGARADLLALYRYIAKHGSPLAALGFVERIESFCMGLRDFPERGARRDDLRPGLRIVGFERRVSIAFHINSRGVFIDRIFYGGRNLDALL